MCLFLVELPSSDPGIWALIITNIVVIIKLYLDKRQDKEKREFLARQAEKKAEEREHIFEERELEHKRYLEGLETENRNIAQKIKLELLKAAKEVKTEVATNQKELINHLELQDKKMEVNTAISLKSLHATNNTGQKMELLVDKIAHEAHSAKEEDNHQSQ